MEKILSENPQSSILLLGRYGFDAFNLGKSADFQYNPEDGSVRSHRFPGVKIEFMTVHRAKGLGYDNVIIINARNELYGFPSQIQEDPVLKYVVKGDYSFDYAEERRLFYVAITRTKNRVYIITPEQHPSQFVTHQLADGYKFAITRSCDVARTGEVFCDDPIDPDVPTETPLEDAIHWIQFP